MENVQGKMCQILLFLTLCLPNSLSVSPPLSLSLSLSLSVFRSHSLSISLSLILVRYSEAAKKVNPVPTSKNSNTHNLTPTTPKS